MNKFIQSIISVLVIAFASSTWADSQENATLRCEYQTGYGEGGFYLGYLFNLKTENFINLTTVYSGQITQASHSVYDFIEATGAGTVRFENGYALLTHSGLQNPVPFVLICKTVDPQSPTVENREFDILAEDPIDGEIKPTLESMNYCGNDTIVLKLDLSKYIEKNSPWYGFPFSTFAERTQFGPAFDCLPGERRRENFKVLNQLLNEARSKGNKLSGKLTIRREPFSPSGYAVKIEIQSENLGRTFVFRDNLSAKYSQ